MTKKVSLSMALFPNTAPLRKASEKYIRTALKSLNMECVSFDTAVDPVRRTEGAKINKIITKIALTKID